MGNACFSFRRKKRLEEEVNFRRKMEQRIQQSSRHLKNIPGNKINEILNNNDLPNIKRADLMNRSNCTPLRPNSQGVFIEVDQQYIEEQLKLNKLNLISANNEWTDRLFDRPESEHNLSRLSQLRLLQSDSNYRLTNQMNSFDNNSFVNTSIDSNLFDQNFYNLDNIPTFITNVQPDQQLNSKQFNQQLNQINSQLKKYSSLHSINRLIKSNFFDDRLRFDDVKGQKNCLYQISQMPASNNILDVAANNIFSELAYIDNRLNETSSGLNFENRLCYLPLDGFMKSNGDNLDLLYVRNFPNQHTSVHSNDIVGNQNKIYDLKNKKLPILSYDVYLNSIESIDNLENRKSLDLLFSSINYKNFTNILSTHSNTFSNNQSDDRGNKINRNLVSLTNEERIKSKAGFPTDFRGSIEFNSEKEFIEEEKIDKKNDMNDSGNGGGCADKQLSRAESIENHIINSQIEIEPWFFNQIKSRLAAEHVLRMRGNRAGAFLVRHAQQIKSAEDAPFVLSLKVLDSPDKILNERQKSDKLQIDSSNFQFHPTLSCHMTSENLHFIKTITKNILHYKIYSRLACPNCNLKMYYINPANQFATIRQLISFYSNNNGGLPIKLDKPCLPFDYFNCCYNANIFLSSTNDISDVINTSKKNCEICNELMSSAKINRWSTGNLSGTDAQLSQEKIMESNEAFQIYIEQNADSFIKILSKSDESNALTAVQLLSRSLNSIKASSVDRISNNGIPVNSTNRILTDIKFENDINKINEMKQCVKGKIRFSNSLDDVGLNAYSGNMLCIGFNNRLSLKDRFRNNSLASINYSDGNSVNLTSSGSSLSRKSSDSKKLHRVLSTSFKENIFKSADNLKRRSSSIRLKPGNSGKYNLTKINSASVTNVSSLKNSNFLI